MYCTSCGKELPNTVRICGCGSHGFSPTPPASPATSQPAYTSAAPRTAAGPGMQYCTSCGKELPNTVRICGCGSHDFSPTPPPSPARTQPTYTPTAQPVTSSPFTSPPSRPPLLWYRWRGAQVAVAVMLVAAVGAGIYGWQYYDELRRQEDLLRRLDQAQTQWAEGNNALVARAADQAIAHYTEAIAILPTFAPAYVSRGSAQLQLTRFEEAKLDYDEAVKRDPTYAEAYFARGVYFWYLGDLVSSESDMRTLVALRPENDFYANWFAQVMWQQHSPSKDAEVERFYRRLYDEDHKREWALDGWLGSIDDKNEAVEECQKLEAQGVSNPMVEYYYGQGLLGLQRYADAIPHLRKAEEGDPTVVPIDVLEMLATAELKAHGPEACYSALKDYGSRMGQPDETAARQKEICEKGAL